MDPRLEVSEGGHRSVAELFRRLATDGSELLRQEIALARAEMRESARSLAKHASQMAVGGGVALLGLLVFLAFVIIGLGMLLGGEYWLSSLIVAIALLGGGGLLVMSGVRRLGRTSLAPKVAIATAQETAAWAKDEAADLRAALSSGDNGAGALGGSALPAARASSTMAVVPLEARPGSVGTGVRAPVADLRPRDLGSGSNRSVAEARHTTRTPGRGPLPVSEPIYKRIFHEFQEDDVLGQGAKIAYFMFTSLPPALLVLFALAGLFGGARLGDYFASQLQRVLPGSADDPSTAAGFINQFIEQVVETSAPGPLSIGLILGIWAGSAVFVALGDSLNTAYDLVDDRSWFKRRALAIGVMTGFVALFLAGSIVLVAGPQIAEAVALAGVAEFAWTVLQWPLAFVVIVMAFFLVYYVLPDRDQSSCKGALFKGSAIAAALWLIATFGFRLYISNFGTYGETYGFIGAILVLLLWMYITGIVILLGGEIASEMEREARA